MTSFDIIVLLLMGGGAVFGFLRGFVQEVLVLGGLVLTVIVIRVAHEPVTAMLTDPLGSATWASVLAFASLFILSYASARTIAARVGRHSRQSLLGPIDRVLGFGFGLVKGLVVATLLFLLIMLVYESLFGKSGGPPGWLERARTHALLNASGALIVDLMDRDTPDEREDAKEP